MYQNPCRLTIITPDRSGNPGSELTRPFLLPIDLNKKNFFHVLTVGIPYGIVSKWLLKVCGTSKVSLFHILVPNKVFLNVFVERLRASADVGACCVGNGEIKRSLKSYQSSETLVESPVKSFQSLEMLTAALKALTS